jgi:hypothetical protein
MVRRTASAGRAIMHTGLDDHLNPDDAAQRRVLTRRLRELPHDSRPPFGWSEFQRRASLRERARSSRSALRQEATAVAACIALMVLALAVWIRLGSAGPEAAPPGANREAAVATHEDAGARPRDELEQVAAAPYGRAIVRVSTRLAVQDLEDRIASVDDQLTIERVENPHDSQVRVLQRERARMIHALAQVRYAENLAAELP